MAARGHLAAVPQASIFERTIENAELEAILEKRETARVAKGKATKTFKQADAAARELLEKIELEEERPARVGRFVVSTKSFPGGSRTFDVAPSSRLYIRPMTEAEAANAAGS